MYPSSSFSLRFIYFLTGITLIGHELVLDSMFSLVFGSHAYGSAFVLGAFLLGLSVGALLFYRINFFSVKFIFSLSCLGGGVCATASLFLVFLYPLTFQNLLWLNNGTYSNLAVLLQNFLVVSLLVFPSGLFYGMLFPSLVRATNYTRRVYTYQLLGESLGCIFYMFVLVRYFGYLESSIILLLLNLVATLLFFKIPLKENEFSKKQTELFPVAKEVYLIAFFSGFSILALEMIWIRKLNILLGDRGYVVSITLFLVILSLAIGSFISKKLDSFFNIHKLLHFSLLVAILSCAFAMTFQVEATDITNNLMSFSNIKLFYIIFSFALPAVALGTLYPACLIFLKGSISDNSYSLAINSSKLLIVNALAGVFGTWFIVGIGFDHLGVHKSEFLIFLILSCLLGYLGFREFKFSFLRNFISVIFALIFLFTLSREPFRIAPKESIVVQRESRRGHFSILNRGENRLAIYLGNHRLNGFTNKRNINHTQQSLVLYPYSVVNNAKKALIIGLGYGISPAAFINHPVQVDVVELLPEVINFQHLFSELNHRFWEKPHINIINNDGRRFLSKSKQRYDLISVNVASGLTNGGILFLSQEFYQNVDRHLANGGVFSQLIWGKTKEIHQTISSVFKYTKMIPGYDEETLILIASQKPLTPKLTMNSLTKNIDTYNGKSWEDIKSIGKKIHESHSFKEKSRIIKDNHPWLLFSKFEWATFFWLGQSK